MAHFIGYLNSFGHQVSRLGTKKCGIDATVQGWHLGARVEMHHDLIGDYVVVFLTHGSNAPGNAQCLGAFRLAEDGTFEQVGQ